MCSLRRLQWAKPDSPTTAFQPQGQPPGTGRPPESLPLGTLAPRGTPPTRRLVSPDAGGRCGRDVSGGLRNLVKPCTTGMRRGVLHLVYAVGLHAGVLSVT